MVEKNARLASKTEELAGRCRRLAIALDTYADSRGFLRAGERKFIRGIAVALTEIAEEMTVALAAGDVEAVKRAQAVGRDAWRFPSSWLHWRLQSPTSRLPQSSMRRPVGPLGLMT